MPEGHSIHRLARAFADGFVGRRLAVSSPQGRFAAGAALLDGDTLVASQAWGKHLFLGFAGGDGPAELALEQGVRWLHVHLGLYGAWTFAGTFAGPHAIGAPRVRVGEEERELPGDDGAAQAAREGVGTPAAGTSTGVWTPPAPRGQVRVRLVSDSAVADLTGPTRCEVLDTRTRDAVVHRLGPDPLRPDPDGAERERFVRAARASRTAIGVLLMDQGVLAGVGNIYRAELLFRARVHPLRPGASLAAGTLRRIWDDAVVLMADGVARGQIVTTEPADRRSMEDRWYVYQRDGRGCLRCRRTVALDDLAGRRVYWCPGCQRPR